MGVDFADYFQEELGRLHPLWEDGLLRFHPDRIEVTSRGRLLLRNIAMCFDRYLNECPQDQAPAEPQAAPRFSRAI